MKTKFVTGMLKVNPMKKQNEFGGFRLWHVVATATFVCMFVALASTGKGQEENSQQDEKSSNELRLDYAMSNLQLAETELKLAEQFNKELADSMPSSIPRFTDEFKQQILNKNRIADTTLARLKSNLQIGRVQFDLAKNPSTGSPEELRKRYAEEKVHLAKVKLDAVKAGKSAGKPVRDLEITRLQLMHQLAQLKLELLGSPENVLTLVDSLQRQIDQLSEEVLTQDQRITALEGAIERINRR